MMRQGKIYHILLDIMKKPGKKKETFSDGFSYKERRITSNIRQKIHNCQGRSFLSQCYQGSTPQKSPRFVQHLRIYLGEFQFIHQCIHQ